MRDLRAEAVAAVDTRHGYTAEHAPDPFAHRMEYDDEEARLQGDVVCSVEGHEWVDGVCVRCAAEKASA